MPPKQHLLPLGWHLQCLQEEKQTEVNFSLSLKEAVKSQSKAKVFQFSLRYPSHSVSVALIWCLKERSRYRLLFNLKYAGKELKQMSTSA